MKKLLLALIGFSIIFASNNEDINKKLDLLLNKLDTLEKKLNEKDKEIERLKKELKAQQKEIKKQEVKTQKELAIKDCKKLKVTSFSYEYHDNVLPYYTFSVTLKNEYPFEITKISGNLYFDDKDGTTLVKHYIRRKLDIKPNKSITINGQHMITVEMEKYLKDENPNNLNVYFSPTRIYFKNGKSLECF